jgi:hypothetical protein
MKTTLKRIAKVFGNKGKRFYSSDKVQFNTDWEKLVRKELKTRDPQELVWHTAEVRLSEFYI